MSPAAFSVAQRVALDRFHGELLRLDPQAKLYCTATRSRAIRDNVNTDVPGGSSGLGSFPQLDLRSG